jgi:tRNA-dihydrouridine synthase B
MIGRAAIGNPWIFARIDRANLTLADVLQAMRLHSQEMMAYFGERLGLTQFRKHLKRYLADMPVSPEWLVALLQAETAVAFAALLAEMETAVQPPTPTFLTHS